MAKPDQSDEQLPTADEIDSRMAGGPVSGGAAPGEPRQKKKLVIVMILLVVILLAAGAVFLLADKKDPTSTSQQPASNNSSQSGNSSAQAQTQAPSPCTTAGTKAYENRTLGFGFCYPINWGSVSVADAKMAAGDSGSRWRLSFSNKEEVNLGVVSDDWGTTAARDGTCVDPAVQTVPPFAPFNTAWVTEGTPTISATRDVEEAADKYLIQERVDDVLTNGACLEGYSIINASTYAHTAATYYKAFYGTVTTPDMHIGSPEFLIPATDRADFAAFVKSVYKL